MIKESFLPDPPDWKLKVERAEYHLDDLNNILNSYRNSGSFKVLEERKPGEWIWTLKSIEPPPNNLSLVVGDVVHNLRSALDCRVVGIAEHLAGRKLTDDEEKPLNFMAFACQDDFDNYTKRWARLPPRVSEGLIKCVGVFQRFANPSKYWTDPKIFDADASFAREQHLAVFDRLTRLSWLSNRDKHRRLTTVLLAPTGSVHSGFQDNAHYEWTPRVLESGDVVARLFFDEAAELTNPSVEISLVPVLVNAVREGDFSLYDELQNIAGFVENALTILEYEVGRLPVE